MLVLGKVNLPAVGFAHTTWDQKNTSNLEVDTKKTQLSKRRGNFREKKKLQTDFAHPKNFEEISHEFGASQRVDSKI